MSRINEDPSQPSALISPPTCDSPRSAFRYLVLTDPARTDQEGLFPEGEISLVLGPSGAGKTTWLLQFIQRWSKGDNFFDRPVCERDFLFLSFDRSSDSLERTAQRLGLDLNTFPHWTPQTFTESQSTPKKILQKLLKLPAYRNVKAVFIEGLDMQVPDGKISDPGAVKSYLSDLQMFAKKRRLTIVGTVGSPKMKQGEKYLSPRERAIGTTYWGRMAETIIVIEPKAADGNEVREMHILPRQAAAEIHCFKWENGQLVEAPCPDGHKRKVSTLANRVEEWLGKNKEPGETFTLDELVAALDEKPNSLIYSLAAEGPLSKKRLIEKVGYGLYKWKAPENAEVSETKTAISRNSPVQVDLLDESIGKPSLP